MAKSNLKGMDNRVQLLQKINTLILENDISEFSYISKYNGFDIFQTAWWNMKWYDWPDKGDRPNGDQAQSFHFKNELISEIPYNRKIGRPSCGRFSSSSNEISYWTNNYDLVVLESKKSDNQYGFPIKRFIKENSKILDLSSNDCTLLTKLNVVGFMSNTSEFYKEILLGRRSEDILATHKIGELAYKKDYSGVIWESAKVEELMNKLGGQICQRYCIVLYSDSCLLESSQ